MGRVFVDVQTKILFQTGIIGVDVGKKSFFLFQLRSSNEYYFNWHFFFLIITWDSFCLLYWWGSYFLTNMSSGKFFFWEEKWGRFNCKHFFFFLTSRGEFFKLLNRSRGLLEAGRHYNVKVEIYYFCQFTILTPFLSFR